MPTDKSRTQLPAASLHLLLALLEGDNHGYALMRRVDELTDGSVRMGPGTLYGTLNRLLKDRLITEVTAEVARDENERRRYYRLTASGEQVAQAELSRLKNLVSRLNTRRVGLRGAST